MEILFSDESRFALYERERVVREKERREGHSLQYVLRIKVWRRLYNGLGWNEDRDSQGTSEDIWQWKIWLNQYWPSILTRVGITFFGNPLRRPNFIPIENVCDVVGRRLRGQENFSNTLKLEIAVREEWENIDQVVHDFFCTWRTPGDNPCKRKAHKIFLKCY